MKDIILLATLLIAFAWLITAHVAITLGLARRRPRWRALVAFALVLPAPIWAWQERMRTRAVLWVVGGLVYVIALGWSFA